MDDQNVQMCFDGLLALAAELSFKGKLPCNGSATCQSLLGGCFHTGRRNNVPRDILKC